MQNTMNIDTLNAHGGFGSTRSHARLRVGEQYQSLGVTARLGLSSRSAASPPPSALGSRGLLLVVPVASSSRLGRSCQTVDRTLRVLSVSPCSAGGVCRCRHGVQPSHLSPASTAGPGSRSRAKTGRSPPGGWEAVPFHGRCGSRYLSLYTVCAFRLARGGV